MTRQDTEHENEKAAIGATTRPYIWKTSARGIAQAARWTVRR